MLALVDSGAAKNFIRTNLLVDVPQVSTKQTFQLAFGVQHIQTQGDHHLNISIDQTDLQATFQALEDLHEQCILGTPFLEEQNVLVDFQRKCLYFGNEQRHTCYWDSTPDTDDIPEPLPENFDIPDEHRTRLQPLLEEFPDLFTTFPSQCTTSTTQHTINLRENAVVNQKPYPMTPQKKAIFYEQIDEMLQAGVIEPSQSPYSSPPVIIE